jgi:hypothetical protein
LKADVLLLSSDNARYVKGSLGLESPMLAFVRDGLRGSGYSTEHIARPISMKNGRICSDDSVQINIAFVFSRVMDNLLRRVLNNFSFEKKMYERILKRVDPKVIVGIELPSALCRAARAQEIKLVEVLHGRGIEIVQPYIIDRDEHSLPNLYVGLDPLSVNTFLKRGLNCQLGSYEYPPNPSDISMDIVEKYILVTLQWGYCGDFLDEPGGLVPQDNGLFINALTDAVAQTNNRWRWRFRLHPVLEQRPGYSDILNQFRGWVGNLDNVDIEESSIGTVEKSAAGSFAHITMSSGSVYEAACSGVASLVLCPSVKKGGARPSRFKDLESINYLYKTADTTPDIISWVDRMSVRQLHPLTINTPTIVTQIIEILKTQ